MSDAASLGGRGGEQLGAVFAALADPTRREMVSALLREESTSVPALSAELPISRQAIAKHLATLEGAGLVRRLPGVGREVRYGLDAGALEPAATWLHEAQRAWEGRLSRLKDTLEQRSAAARGGPPVG